MAVPEGHAMLEGLRDRIASTITEHFELIKRADAIDNPDCECGTEHYPLGSMLNDWVLIASFIEPEGDHCYFKLSSSGISPHARKGLAKELEERT